ncbi:MAG TPA: hypothetical protein VH253_02575 [Phycisphaerae bacterium]|nr:hypothetical protein [Phycisphaerae bacterium]
MRRSLAIAVLPLALAACQPGAPGAGRKFTGSGMDMFTPVNVRVHPLSRLVPAAGNEPAAVQARLEFTDQFHDVTKAAGTGTFELFATAPIGRGPKLASWTVNLNDPAANHEHWDAVTRTYLFTLPLPSPSPAAAGVATERGTLAVTFTLPNGQKLTDSAAISSH